MTRVFPTCVLALPLAATTPQTAGMADDPTAEAFAKLVGNDPLGIRLPRG